MERVKFTIPEAMCIDRTIDYKECTYQIVEVLNSEMVLVVKKDEFDKGNFPLQTYIIPGQ